MQVHEFVAHEMFRSLHRFDGFGTFSTYFARLPELNRRGPKRIDTLPALRRLDADEVGRSLADGAVVVDARPFSADDAVTLMCGHGERAMSAASLLAARRAAARGFDGGPDTWATATGRALEAGR